MKFAITAIIQDIFIVLEVLHVTEETAQGIDIKVLGQGCPQCDRLEQELMAILSETGIPAMIEHVRYAEEISKFGFLRVPALVINAEIKASGSVLPKAKLMAIIQQAANQKKIIG